MNYNTIITGRGLAGLIAGGILSKFGKQVLLLEQHHKPGFVVEVWISEMRLLHLALWFS